MRGVLRQVLLSVLFGHSEESKEDGNFAIDAVCVWFVHLRIALQTLWEHHLYAKLSKCEVWLSEVVFFGHVVLATKISVDPVKIEIVLRWEEPTTTIVFWNCPDIIGVYTWFLFFGGHSHTADKEGGALMWTHSCEKSF